MWTNPAIDSLLNPEYNKVTDYRKLFRLIGYQICVDVGTRTEDDSGEAHILLIHHEGAWGILAVHDQFEKGLPPQFCMPYPKSVERFHQRLDDKIEWFNEPQQILDWIEAGEYKDSPFGIVQKKTPLIAGFFFRDMLEFFKEKGIFLLTN